jgi:hypothetical protein
MGAIGNGAIGGASSNTSVLNLLPDWSVAEEAISKDLVFKVSVSGVHSERMRVPYLNN